ncbi:sushi, von Willebrand factor type A, EGF and pentraxin domain-containing protein 1-like [Liolophura sinensis]|uniref:sushi, von Willebrand factor type A, EGF and pentraxin domain-containing protein 1-like n=1 Tax=Liolophura sinensis TaxID=3198878 RepID=UPI003158BC46
MGFYGDGKTCTEALCPALSSPENGFIEHSDGNKTNDETHFACNPGYNINGSAILKCRHPHMSPAGKWSDAVPTCENACSSQGCSVGSVCVTQETGSKCVCEDGYEMSGSKCTLVRCTSLEGPTNGSATSAEQGYGAVINFRCDFGFHQRKPTSVVCSKNGTWLGTVPTCEPIPCNTRLLHKPEHGEMNQTEELSGIVTVTFSCDYGFHLIGQDTILCLTNGQWTGSAPICQASRCPLIDGIRHGKASSNVTKQGETVTFTCDTRFNLEGPGTVQCNGTGHWNDSLPYCKPIRNLWNCSDIKDLELKGQGARVNCTKMDSVYSECSIQCQGHNRTYQPSRFNKHICDTEERFPGWLVFSSLGSRAMELGSCVEPVNPLMTLSIEGLFAEVTLHDKDTDPNGCLRNILDIICGSKCKASEVRLQTLSPTGGHREFMEIQFTLSQPTHTGGGVTDQDKVVQEWNNTLNHMKDVVNNLQNNMSTGTPSSCENNASFAWLENQILVGTQELDCPAGYTAEYPFCYPCPSGSFYHRDMRRCDPCPIGFYQPNQSSSHCIKCPGGTTTAREGTKASSGCLGN